MNKASSTQENSLMKDCIFTALIKLMEQKNFEDITVTEIAKKAGVSRMTYYRNYSSKEDILIQHFDESTRALIQQVKLHPDISPYQLCCQFFSFFQEHSSLVDQMFQAVMLKLMLRRLTETTDYLFHEITKPDLPDNQLKYQLHFITGGLFSLLLHWIETGKKESPQEMAALAGDMIEVRMGKKE